MPVNVCGHLNIGVTHVFLNIFQRKAVVQKEAGAAVPKLMETDMRQMVVLQEKREMGGNVIRGEGRILGWGLAAGGYDGALATQAQSALNAETFLLFIVPTIASAVCFLCMWFWDIDGKIAEMKKKNT